MLMFEQKLLSFTNFDFESVGFNFVNPDDNNAPVVESLFMLH